MLFDESDFDSDLNLSEIEDSNSSATSIINGDEVDPNARISISDAQPAGNVNITYRNEDGDETFSFERPQAALNIFDSQYYLNSNPDVADSVTGRYEGSSLSISTNLQEAELPGTAPSGINQITTTGGGTTIIDGTSNTSISEYTSAVEHYVTSGAVEGRVPSPLFDSEYYLEQNPDVASALAGGDFSSDPLLHYVATGAAEGRDPNAFFDSDYYLSENPEVVDTGLNPLEHYVLFGSSSGADPSPDFDPDFYLSQNPDVANAGIDPLTHFLVFGQEEGRSAIAES